MTKLAIPNNKVDQQTKKSIMSALMEANSQGLLPNEIVDLLEEKFNESGELNFILSKLKEEDKAIKESLKETPQYRTKIKIAKKMKEAKALQERNLDETRGALETVKTLLGESASKEFTKLLKL